GAADRRAAEGSPRGAEGGDGSPRRGRFPRGETGWPDLPAADDEAVSRHQGRGYGITCRVKAIAVPVNAGCGAIPWRIITPARNKLTVMAELGCPGLVPGCFTLAVYSGAPLPSFMPPACPGVLDVAWLRERAA